jgi:hypothetical protein
MLHLSLHCTIVWESPLCRLLDIKSEHTADATSTDGHFLRIPKSFAGHQQGCLLLQAAYLQHRPSRMCVEAPASTPQAPCKQ